MSVVVGVTSHVRTRWPEWALSLLIVFQSTLVLLGHNLHKNQLYTVLWKLIDLRHAAFGADIVGMFWLIALVLNGTFVTFRRISPWIRVVTGTACALYWFMWAIALYHAAHDFTSLGWTNNAALSLMSATCVLMAARETAIADRKAKQWRRLSKLRTGGRSERPLAHSSGRSSSRS